MTRGVERQETYGLRGPGVFASYYQYGRAYDTNSSRVVLNGNATVDATSIRLIPNTSYWTAEDVTVTAEYGVNLTEARTLECTGTSGTDYIVNGTTNVVVKTNNNTVTATAKDGNGNIKTATLTITNIDKNPPIVIATAEELTIKQGDSNSLETYFDVDVNGEAPIEETVYVNTSNDNEVITNINTLEEGIYTIECTVTKVNGLSDSDIIRIIVQNGTDGTWSDNKGVNTPLLMDGMTAVYWSTDGGKTASIISESATPIYSKIGGISTGEVNPAFDWSNWYKYTGNNLTNRWANAVTDDGSYWVWIPRYKYLISEQPTTVGETNAGKVTIKFIPITDRKGASGYTTVANSDGEILTTDSEGYIIHPAFEDGSSNGKNNGYANGEWDSELPGFWMAKYEMSMEDGNGNHIETASADIGNIKIGSNVKMVSKPNVSSWRYIQIGQIYQNCLAYDTAKNSHLIKDSEWGAVAYLAHSQYGRNKNEVTANDSNGFYTGNAGDSTTDTTSQSTIGNAYDTTAGMKASTTGNIYGVYDMNAGAWEYTSSWAAKSTGSNITNYGKAIDGTIYYTSGGSSSRYMTAYNNTGTYYGSTTPTVCKTGDGIKETYVADWYLWFGAGSWFVAPGYEFMLRGGFSNQLSTSGLFASYSDDGKAVEGFTFRTVLSKRN